MIKKIQNIPYSKIRIVLLIALAIFLIITAFRQCDFNIFFTAAKDIRGGEENLYTKIYQGWLHYYYSPLFAVLLIPFTFFSEYVITLLWLILNTYLFYRVWGILRDWLELNLLPIKTQRIIFWVSVLAGVQGIRDNLHYHQITIIMVYIVLQGMDWILKKKDWQGAALIALGINIKIMPIVFFPYLIYRKHWKAVFGIIIFWILFLILPAVFIGWEYNNFLLAEWWKGIDPRQTENVLDFARAGFAALVTALFHSDAERHHAIFISQFSQETIALITNVMRAVVAIFTLYFLRTFPFQNAKSKQHRTWEIGYLFWVTPFIFPHQQNYAYFYIYPAIVYLLFYFYSRRSESAKWWDGFSNTDKWKLRVLALAWVMMSAELFLGTFRDFYIEIKLMTWAAIVGLMVFVFCLPRHLEILSSGDN